MKKLNLNRGLKTVKSVITANSPVLLVGATITGVVATGVLAARGGYKARGIVDAAQAEKGPENPLTTQEKVQLTWLCYAPAALAGAGSISSCLGVHFVHTKRFAELAGLYAVTSGKLDNMKDEVEEMLTGKKKQDLDDRLAQKSADNSGFVNNEVVITQTGTELCYDDWTGRWFTSNMNAISAAVNEANALLIDEGELDLNTFYDRLGITNIPMGTDFGWQHSKTGKLSLIYGNITAPDGRPAIAISFRDAPQPKLGR